MTLMFSHDSIATSFNNKKTRTRVNEGKSSALYLSSNEVRTNTNYLKLLSQSWLILISKIKTNKNKQNYVTDYHYQ